MAEARTPGEAAAAAEVLETLLARIRGLLAEIFAGPEAVAAEVVRRRRAVLSAGGTFRAGDLTGIRAVVEERLAAQPMADGLGFLTAAGLLPDRERHITWWQRVASGLAPMRLNLDPTTVDVYDYFEMEWFAAARDEGRRAVFGPYVDYSAADHYVCTFTVPVVDGAFLGVAGTDLRMDALEPRLLGLLRGAGHDAVLVGPERRVVAANSPRWLVGARLPRLPHAGDGVFLAVGEVGRDSGWVLALAARG
ncbi:cache domain-containing protein [Streptomyces sp. NPDC007264]|uniref:cache domain-containing protein n=1 Tax=Streptomyces sp. NPDC007264 TaxID=3364777 RepID=UPI0036DE919A